MSNFIYEVLSRYFNTLSILGYKEYLSVYKVLLLILIKDFIDRDYYGYLTKEDYNTVNKALYCIYGTTCLIPYSGKYSKTMNKLYLGSMSEIAYRLSQIEDDVEAANDKIKTIENTKVVKPDTTSYEIQDIQMNDL